MDADADTNTLSVTDRAIAETRKYIDKANQLYNLSMAYPKVSFDVRGCTAGYALPMTNHIQYNMTLLVENIDKFLARTVPHEVAHIVAFVRNGCRRVKSHGYEWRNIMYDFGVQDVTRCHSYAVTNVREVGKGFIYACGCREYNFTIIRHRRAQKALITGGAYKCGLCKSKLVKI